MNKMGVFLRILVILFLCVIFTPGCSTKPSPSSEKFTGLLADQDGQLLDKALIVVTSVYEHRVYIPLDSRHTLFNLSTTYEYKEHRMIAEKGVFVFDGPIYDDFILSEVKMPGYKTVKPGLQIRNNLNWNNRSHPIPIKVYMEKE